jgi:hypothetical protein
MYMKYLDDAKKDRARVDVQTLSSTAEAYKLRFGDYPASLEVLTQPTPDGGIPYLDVAALLDPWNRPYQYAAEGTHNAHLGKCDIWSTGPRLNDPNGIIGNWSLGQGGT